MYFAIMKPETEEWNDSIEETVIKVIHQAENSTNILGGDFKLRPRHSRNLDMDERNA